MGSASARKISLVDLKKSPKFQKKMKSAFQIEKKIIKINSRNSKEKLNKFVGIQLQKQVPVAFEPPVFAVPIMEFKCITDWKKSH